MKAYLPALLWAAVIFILTMMPGKFIAPVNVWDIANLDKLAHLGVFAILILLALHGAMKRRGFRVLPVVAVILPLAGCAAYGLLLEVLQSQLTADRLFEWHDALANTFGCLLGAALFRYAWQKKLAAQ